MSPDPELRLHEEVLLLTLKDEKGTPAWTQYTYALAGAILAELVLEERVRLEERKRRKPLVHLVSATQIGDPILDDALRAIRVARRRATAGTWIQRWARNRLLHETARRLARRGILQAREKRVLLLFSRTVYPELNPEPEQRLIERMRAAIFGSDDVDARTATVISLAGAADLLKPIFGKELKGRKDRLEALAEGDAVSEVTRATVQAVRAAVVAAGTAATAAATT